MKKLAACLAALVIIHPAFAALSVVTGHYVQGNPPGTCSIGSAVGSGQVDLLFSLEATQSTLTVSDSVNTGNYSQLGAYNAGKIQVFWMTTNASASGTTIITVSGSSGYSYYWCMAVTGFVGTPTQDTSITNPATGGGNPLAINATSNFNNEIMLIGVGGSGGPQPITVSGWSAGATGSSANSSAMYAIEPIARTANNFSGTVSSSETWYLLLTGIYDPGIVPSRFFLSGYNDACHRPRILSLLEMRAASQWRSDVICEFARGGLVDLAQLDHPAGTPSSVLALPRR